MDSRAFHALLRRPSARCGSSAAGFTQVEMVVTAAVMMMIFTGVVAITGAVARTTDRGRVDSKSADGARRSMDEMLLHLRNGNAILDNVAVSGMTCTTTTGSGPGTSAGVVFRAPAFDAVNNAFLLGTYDTISFRYDPSVQGGTLFESIAPGAAASARTARSNMVLARGVGEMRLIYRVRERFSTASAPASPTLGPVGCLLKVTPGGAPSGQTQPLALVNGVPRACTWVSGTNQVTVSATRGDDLQIIYPVAPTATSRDLISEVDVSLTMSGVDSRLGVRTTVLQGGARLRNMRN